MIKNEYDIIIIGGGPAGLTAAAEAASRGAGVLVAEKTASCGRKLLISGSGRCNITNTILNTKEFIGNITNGKFLYQALNAYKTADAVSFFNSKGLKTVVERGTKVFPDTGGSIDVLNILMSTCARSGVDFTNNSPVTEIKTKDGKISGVVCGGRDIACKAVIIATGGMSYPKTGSSGDGYALAQHVGHNIIKPRPVLVPAYTESKWVKDVEGLSLRDIELTLWIDGRKTARSGGDLVFTEKGISGPAVYDLSRLAETSGDGCRLTIDIFPHMSGETLDAQLEESIKNNNKKIIKNILDEYLVSALVPVAFDITGVLPDTRVSNMKASDRKRLVGFMKAMPLENVTFAGFERAVVTQGGVDTREIDGRTMVSKKIENLFFAGEVVDVDGPTGGYNLQICWSTGKLAGICAADAVKNKK